MRSIANRSKLYRDRLHKQANPTESTFAPVWLRTKATKGPGPRGRRDCMAYKLIDAAQTRWRAANAPHLTIAPEVGHSSQRS